MQQQQQQQKQQQYGSNTPNGRKVDEWTEWRNLCSLSIKRQTVLSWAKRKQKQKLHGMAITNKCTVIRSILPGQYIKLKHIHIFRMVIILGFRWSYSTDGFSRCISQFLHCVCNCSPFSLLLPCNVAFARKIQYCFVCECAKRSTFTT